MLKSNQNLNVTIKFWSNFVNTFSKCKNLPLSLWILGLWFWKGCYMSFMHEQTLNRPNFFLHRAIILTYPFLTLFQSNKIIEDIKSKNAYFLQKEHYELDGLKSYLVLKSLHVLKSEVCSTIYKLSKTIFL